MLRSLLILLVAVIINSNNYAQTQSFEYADSSLLINMGDSATVSPYSQNDILDTMLYEHEIQISSDTIASWKADKKFAYVKNMESLLKQKEKEYMDDYKESNRHSGMEPSKDVFSTGWIQVFFWIIAIFLVLLILYKLFINKGVFRKKLTANSLTEIEEKEPVFVPVSNLDTLVNQSVKAGDYRLAVRYLFLKTLRHLFDKGLLQQSADKTNFQYVHELEENRRKEFSSLVLTYEYVWYGHQHIGRDQYDQIEIKFSSFNPKM